MSRRSPARGRKGTARRPRRAARGRSSRCGADDGGVRRAAKVRVRVMTSVAKRVRDGAEKIFRDAYVYACANRVRFEVSFGRFFLSAFRSFRVRYNGRYGYATARASRPRARVARRDARGAGDVAEGNVRRRRARGAKIENFVSRRLSVPRSRRARPREAGDRVHALDVRLNDRPRAVVASHAVLAGSHAAVVPVPEERAGEVAVRGGRLSTRAMGSV